MADQEVLSQLAKEQAGLKVLSVWGDDAYYIMLTLYASKQFLS